MSEFRRDYRAVLLIVTSSLLFGCLGLPTESVVARKYEGEHRGGRVLKVTKISESLGNVTDARVRFYIDYETSDSRVMQDVWTYGRVAEGWIRVRHN